MGEEEESSSVCKTASGRFRWLCLARFAVALAVTVLAALVVSEGLNLVLAPRPIELNISRSNLFVNETSKSLRFYLEAINPSKVVFIFYRDITVQLFDDDTSPRNNSDEPFATFKLNPSSLLLSQSEEQEYLVYSENLDMTEFSKRKNGKAIMVLSGNVTVDNIKHSSTAHFPAMFSCEPVDIKTDTELPRPSSKNYKSDCQAIPSSSIDRSI